VRRLRLDRPGYLALDLSRTPNLLRPILRPPALRQAEVGMTCPFFIGHARKDIAAHPCARCGQSWADHHPSTGAPKPRTTIEAVQEASFIASDGSLYSFKRLTPLDR
jgi:hypothetical protein